ncbi:UNKNOWN [Stylonychia lemnae]|uniref:Tetraspanin family protein n=1 Tax=Stylonychia lemnae TaxID=5949 RepID=A0A078A8Z9_STYLE|nr:UNKNOWN [Stylonychia lemnae]|eukprot:CDW77278.1 UNKNOWN [Stylonychia lemnae]
MTGLLLSLGLITMMIGNDLRDYLHDYCSNNTFDRLNQAVIELQDGYNHITDSLMCSSNCNCVPVAQEEWALIGYNIKSNNFTGTNKDVSSCIDYQKYDQNTVKVMRELENEFGCTGICQPKKFFLFSDVSQGPPKKECYKNLRQYIKDYVINIGMGFVICGAFISLAWCFHISFYFKEPEDAQKKRILKYRNYFPQPDETKSTIQKDK